MYSVRTFLLAGDGHGVSSFSPQTDQKSQVGDVFQNISIEDHAMAKYLVVVITILLSLVEAHAAYLDGF